MFASSFCLREVHPKFSHSFGLTRLEGLVPEHLAGLTQGLPVSLGDIETVLFMRNAEPNFAPGKHELQPRSVCTDIRCELK